MDYIVIKIGGSTLTDMHDSTIEDIVALKNQGYNPIIVHGGGPFINQSLELQKVESKLLYFPLENHWVLKAENQIKWYDEVFAWLKTYLA